MSGFELRPIARSDFDLLTGWLRQPHVQRWWCDDPAPDAMEAEYGAVIDGREAAEVFIAWREGHPVGVVQRYALAAYPRYVDDIRPWTEVPPAAWSLDYFIGEPGLLRRGWGTELVGQFTKSLWAGDPRAGSVLVPVHVDNRASWRVLERNGYRRAASAELEPDNPADSRAHFIYRTDRPDPRAAVSVARS